jgi:hypothetical protein
MTMPVPAGHVRALVERPSDPALIEAARAVFAGSDPREIAGIMRSYREYPRGLIVDPSFGAVPIGTGSDALTFDDPHFFVNPEKSKKFLVSGFVSVPSGGTVPAYLDDKSPIHSNPLVGGLKPPPCRPTCGSSEAVGDADTVRQRLDFQTLQNEGLDGSGVAIAIVDSGIFLPRLERLLGEAMKPARSIDLDRGNSWKPPGLATRPGNHRVGHGTMCAYDALIAAPNATLLDIPMLLARPAGAHRVTETVDAAVQAYSHLLKVWLLGTKSFDAMVVSNSWGLFHPSLEDFPPTHPGRFIDNPNHVLNLFVRVLTFLGVDIVFCGNNCGDGRNCAGDCASGTCLSKTDRMIMGANAYQDVLTVGGCDTNDEMVGYSSRGPSILNMYQNKPDLVAYTHFLGSKSQWFHVPDTGVSAACPVAAGCVAALRTQSKGTKVPSAQLFDALRNTAHKPVGPTGWDPAFGYGIIRPVAAGRALGIIP